MANDAGIGIEFIVIAALVGLVAKEVNVCVCEAATVGKILFIFNMAEAVCLVPAVGEDVKGDLATDCEARRRKNK